MLDDDVKKESGADTTYFLIGICICVYLVQHSTGNVGIGSSALQQWSLFPVRLLSHPDVTQLSTLLTALFLHAGPLHLVGTMFFLWLFGRAVESRMGHGVFLGFYLLCGLLTNLLFVLFEKDSLACNLGASGAVCGVMGAYLIFNPFAKIKMYGMDRKYSGDSVPVSVPAIVFMALFFGLIGLFPFANPTMTPGQAPGQYFNFASFFAHSASFAFGMLVAKVRST